MEKLCMLILICLLSYSCIKYEEIQPKDVNIVVRITFDTMKNESTTIKNL